MKISRKKSCCPNVGGGGGGGGRHGIVGGAASGWVEAGLSTHIDLWRHWITLSDRSD